MSHWILSRNTLSRAMDATRCIAGRTCTDDSGPNLLVRGVEFLLLLSIAAAALWAVRRVRRWLWRGK